MTQLSSPIEIQQRLENIEQDLAYRQNEYAHVAEQWFLALREREEMHARKFLEAKGTVAERNSEAVAETRAIGEEWESKYVALKAVVGVLEGRATILQSLLKAQR